ncbi:MAG: hypothetical protein WED82_13275 [Balneolales bacterium]
MSLAFMNPNNKQQGQKDDPAQQIRRQIENAQTRLGAVGQKDIDNRNWFEKATNLPEGQNALFDTLDLLDRPGNAIRNVVSSVQENQDSRNPFKAGLEGFSGEKRIRGSELLSGMDDGFKKSALGFGLDVGLDPLTYTPAAVFKAAGRGLGKGAKAITPEPIQKVGRAASDAAGEVFNVRHGMDRTLTGQGKGDLEKIYRDYHDTQRYLSDEVQKRGIDAVKTAGGFEKGADVGKHMEGVFPDAPPEIRKASEMFQEGNKVTSDYAIQSGIPLNVQKNYMSHVTTAKGQDLLDSVNKAGSGTGKKRTIAQGGDFRVISQRYYDMPVDEANKLLKEKYNVDFDVFETNAARASVIGQQRLINLTAAENARKAVLENPNLARKLKPGETVKLGDNEVILKPEDYSMFTKELDNGETIMGAKKGDEYVTTKAVKRFLDDADPKMSNEGLQKFLKGYDKVHQMWKQTALFSAGFHLRNAIGNMYNMWVSGMPIPKIAQYQKRAIEDITKKGKNLDEFKRQGLMEESIYRQDFGAASPEKELMKRVQRADSPLKGRLRDPDKVDPITGQARPSVSSVYDAPFDASRELGLNIDLFNRYAHFRYLRDQGLSPAKAAEKVREVLFDYSALTKTERQIKRVVPFYTWMRNNIPFQLKALATNPKKAAQTDKFISATVEGAGIDPETVPEWVQDAFNPAISGDGEGSGQFAGLNLPLSDLSSLSNPLRMATGALTPLAKLPIELGTNYDTFRERPIKDFEGEKGDTFGLPAKADHALSQIGALRNLAGHAESVGSGDVGSFLTAGIPREHNAEQAEYFRLLDELRRLQDAMDRYQQAEGVRPPTINEIQSGGNTGGLSFMRR